MPRMDGVSSRSTIWLRRVKPRPLTTSLCLTGVQILERKYCSLILAVAFLVAIGLELLGNLLSEELELFDSFAAQGGDFGLVAKLDESIEGGLDDVVRVRGAEAFGEHVLHAGGGHDGANRLAGDDAGTFGGGLEHDLAGAVVAEDLVRNRALGEVDLVQVLLGGLDPLADGLGDLFRLAGAVADYAFAGVTDDDEFGEGHVLATLDDLGDAVDRNDLLLEVEEVRLGFFP